MWISVFQLQIQLSILALSMRPQKKIYRSHSSYYGYHIRAKRKDKVFELLQ